MEILLRSLFDFQKFENEPSLAGIIGDVEKRYRNKNIVMLSDNDLSFVAAAGEITQAVTDDEKESRHI